MEKRQQAEQEGHEKEEETTQHRTRKARTVWVREWLARRHEFGNYDQLFTELHKKDPRNYLTPITHRRRDETVLSRRRRRRRCEHEFATSWRQFRRIVGVNTPVGSRNPVYNFLC